MPEIGFRFQSAAGQEGIGHADCDGVFESSSDVEIIIIFQEAPVNDVENIPLMLVPVFPGKLGGDGFKLFFQPVRTGDAIAGFQRRRHSVAVFFLILPEIGRRRVFASVRVGHIEYETQYRPAAAVVDQGDALRVAADVPAHPPVPDFSPRAGGGVRALGKN